MPENVIKSKITAPRIHDKIIHRERLTKLLNENIHKNLIIICAPAGYGKTTLLLDYLSTHHNNYAWLSIPSRGIVDISMFFEYLINSLKKIDFTFGNQTLDIMKSCLRAPKLQKEMLHVVFASFINEFIKFFKEDIIIIIDDLHYIDSEQSSQWLNDIFNELLSNVPANMHLIIMTRIIPDINFTALKAKRNIFIIEEAELNFDSSETGQLLEKVYDYKYSLDDVKILEENIEGWITGIHLILQAYGADFNKVKYSGEIAKDNIFEFFAYEIFDNLSEELRNFLIDTSLLENFYTDICDDILDIQNSKDLINEIVHKNLFIQKTPEFLNEKQDGIILYSYHSLLRNFLNKKLNEKRTAYEISLLRKKIAGYYLKSNDLINALNYFAEAGDFNKVTTLIIGNFEIFMNERTWSTLIKLLNAYPDNLINRNPYLLYLLGLLYFYMLFKHKESLDCMNKAIALLKNENNEDLIVKCYSIKTAALIHTGHIDTALKMLTKLLKRKLKPENKVVLLQKLAWVSAKYGQHTKSIKLYNEALLIINKSKLLKHKADVLRGLGESYRYTGEKNKALQFLEKAVDTTDNIKDYIELYLDISACYCDTGNYNLWHVYYNKAYELLKILPSKYLMVNLLINEASVMTIIGDYEKSLEILKTCYNIVELNNDVIVMNAIDLYCFSNNYFMKKYDNCLEYINKIRKNADEVTIYLCDTIEASVSLEYNFSNNIEDKLLKSLHYFETNDHNHYKNISILYLSVFYLRTKRPGLTINYLKIFLKETKIGANDIIIFRDLIDFVLSSSELKLFKTSIHESFTVFFNRLNLKWTSDEYNRKMMIQVESLYDIKMKLFGTLQIVSRGNTVPDSKWRKKKGRSMLAYMMLNPSVKYNKDKLIELFFQDSKPEKAEESFRQAVYNIRNVFKNPYLNILIYEDKMLQLNPDCYYKSDTAEFDRNYSIALTASKNKEERIKACKAAIELYKGDFLEGYYEPWCEDLREEYSNKLITLSELLLKLLEEEKNYYEIIDYSQKLLKFDNLNDSAYTSLIEAFSKIKNFKSAKTVYDKMIKTYSEECGEKPRIETLNRINQILNM